MTTAMLKTMEDKSIFSVSLNSTGTVAEFIENCDYYFTCTLSKREVRELAEELLALAGTMHD